MIAVDNRWGDDQLRHQTSVAVGGARRNAARTACSARKRSRDGLSPDDSGPPPPLTPPNWRPSTAGTGYALSSAPTTRATRCRPSLPPPFHFSSSSSLKVVVHLVVIVVDDDGILSAVRSTPLLRKKERCVVFANLMNRQTWDASRINKFVGFPMCVSMCPLTFSYKMTGALILFKSN